MIFYSPGKRDAYMSHMGDLGYVPAVSEAVSKATDDLDLSSALATFRFPTLVLNGRYDMNVAPLTAWRLAHAASRTQSSSSSKRAATFPPMRSPTATSPCLISSSTPTDCPSLLAVCLSVA